MMSVNEKMLNIAENMFNTMAQAMYLRYGDAYCLSTLKNCFILIMFNTQNTNIDIFLLLL